MKRPALGIMALVMGLHEPPVPDRTPPKPRKPSGKDRSKAKAARKQRKKS